jgi:hypothetical protein
MKLEKLNLDEVKDLLNNSTWRNDLLSYRFINDTLHLSGIPAAKYELVENEGKIFISFESHLIMIENVNEYSLTLNDKGVIFTLDKVL